MVYQSYHKYKRENKIENSFVKKIGNLKMFYTWIRIHFFQGGSGSTLKSNGS